MYRLGTLLDWLIEPGVIHNARGPAGWSGRVGGSRQWRVSVIGPCLGEHKTLEKSVCEERELASHGDEGEMDVKEEVSNQGLVVNAGDPISLEPLRHFNQAFAKLLPWNWLQYQL